MKLVVSDLDGTFLTKTAGYLKKLRDAVQNLSQKGVDFAIATGRGIGSIREFKKFLGTGYLCYLQQRCKYLR